MQNGTTLETKRETFWTNLDKAELVKFLSVIIEGQNAYGKQHNLETILSYYTLKLQDRFTVSQVIYAIDRYTDTHDDVPTPSGIIRILSPEKPKISRADFVEAQKWQERNQNWSEFTDAAMTIKEYRAQNAREKTEYQTQTKEITLLAGDAVKRLNQIVDGGKEVQEAQRERILARRMDED